MTALVGGIINDAQQLIRQELALARREVQEEVNKAKTAALSLAVGVFITVFGGVLLSLMLVHLLHWLTNGMPAGFPLWACYGIVGGAFAFLGFLMLYAARSKASDINLMPRQSVETMKENVQWIKNQT
jgi:hypothetical protein